MMVCSCRGCVGVDSNGNFYYQGPVRVEWGHQFYYRGPTWILRGGAGSDWTGDDP